LKPWIGKVRATEKVKLFAKKVAKGVKRERSDGAKIAVLSPKAKELEVRRIDIPQAPAREHEENGETRTRIPGRQGSYGKLFDRQATKCKEGVKMNQVNKD